MVAKSLYLLFALVIFLDPVFLVLYSNYMKPVGLKCLNNPKRLVNLTCSIKAKGRKDYTVNLIGDLVQPLRNFSTRFELFRRYNGYRPFVPNITEYFCEYMAGKRRSPMLNIITKHLRHVSTFNTTCPYTKRIEVHDLRYMPEAIPSLFPQGKYKLRVTMEDDTEGEPYVMTFIIILEISEDINKRIK